MVLIPLALFASWRLAVTTEGTGHEAVGGLDVAGGVAGDDAEVDELKAGVFVRFEGVEVVGGVVVQRPAVDLGPEAEDVRKGDGGAAKDVEVVAFGVGFEEDAGRVKRLDEGGVIPRASRAKATLFRRRRNMAFSPVAFIAFGAQGAGDCLRKARVRSQARRAAGRLKACSRSDSKNQWPVSG